MKEFEATFTAVLLSRLPVLIAGRYAFRGAHALIYIGRSDAWDGWVYLGVHDDKPSLHNPSFAHVRAPHAVERALEALSEHANPV